jgi:hypothetical protein
MSHNSAHTRPERLFMQVERVQVHPNVRLARLPSYYDPEGNTEVTALPQHGPNIQATCALLKILLTDDPNYRRRWRAHSGRTSGLLNQASVAKVIESHLWEIGEYSNNNDASIARMLKDRVSRALTGKVLSSETLTWMIDAFAMTKTDRDRLWDIFSGKEEPGSEISHTLRRRREMLRRQCHRTVNLVERYTVNSDGALSSRHTIQTIRAIEDGVDIYIFNHEPPASHVDVIYGGRLGKKYEYGDGLCSVEIELHRSLTKDDTIGLDYRTYYDQGVASMTEVRRTAFARVENIDLAVTFEGLAPRYAWWCVWDDHLDGQPVEERRVDIINGAVRLFVGSIEETVVGFRWAW